MHTRNQQATTWSATSGWPRYRAARAAPTRPLLPLSDASPQLSPSAPTRAPKSSSSSASWLGSQPRPSPSPRRWQRPRRIVASEVARPGRMRRRTSRRTRRRLGRAAWRRPRRSTSRSVAWFFLWPCSNQLGLPICLKSRRLLLSSSGVVAHDRRLDLLCIH